MQIFIGNHRPAAIPVALTNNVNETDIKCISGANHRTDIEVVLPVFDRNLQGMAFGIKIGDYRFNLPLSVMV